MVKRTGARGRPAGATTAATKARLLRAARAVFAEQGYAGAAIADIVARAGVSPPVLYHHFQSKAGLYAAATAEVYDEVVSRLESAVANVTSFEECIDRILVEAVSMHESDPTMSAFIVSAPAVVHTHPELAFLSDELRRSERFFESVVERTGGLPGHSPRASVSLLRMLSGGMTRLSATLPPIDVFDEAVQALRAALGTRAAPDPSAARGGRKANGRVIAARPQKRA